MADTGALTPSQFAGFLDGILTVKKSTLAALILPTSTEPGSISEILVMRSLNPSTRSLSIYEIRQGNTMVTTDGEMALALEFDEAGKLINQQELHDLSNFKKILSDALVLSQTPMAQQTATEAPPQVDLGPLSEGTDIGSKLLNAATAPLFKKLSSFMNSNQKSGTQTQPPVSPPSPQTESPGVKTE
jgi:hypothetical protein